MQTKTSCPNIIRHTIKALALLSVLPACASATCYASIPAIDYMQDQLQAIGWPIGWFMVALMGIKWIISEGPEAREDARRGVIYVVIGLILLMTAESLTIMLFC